MKTAREEILARIDAALGPITGAGTSTGTGKPNPEADWQTLDRRYIRRDTLAGASLVELFEHRITDYGAHVFHTSPEGIRDTIEQVLTGRSAKNVLIPAGVPADWLPASVDFTLDDNLAYDALNRFDGVLTTATIAIAATGSIVLQHGTADGGQGRRAITLIPDYHLCIVNANQIVETVPASFARLDPTKPTTFISGPSATADIEMTRIKGVHGPRFMDVVLVGL
jgi:L-lactate dehydrogenase complex protein LldG